MVAQGLLESDQTTSSSATEEHEGGASKWDKVGLAVNKHDNFVGVC